MEGTGVGVGGGGGRHGGALGGVGREAQPTWMVVSRGEECKWSGNLEAINAFSMIRKDNMKKDSTHQVGCNPAG